MIEFYKIGKKWYEDHDKNSGLFEANILEKELVDIHCDKKVLIILNGKFFNIEEEVFLLSYMKSFDIKIFIASDIVALDNNRSIINNCQYLLHQCPANDMIEDDKLIQLYSWVPEVFYTYSKQLLVEEKQNKLIFGGGVRDNEHKISEYLSSVPSVSYLKTNTYDNRLEYTDYLMELAKCKYTIIIARQAYNDIGWVTARYCEAIANNTIPICDSTYDRSNHFAVVRVSSKEELKRMIEILNQSEEFYRSLLTQEHHKLASRQNNFRNLIIDIIGGKYADKSRDC